MQTFSSAQKSKAFVLALIGFLIPVGPPMAEDQTQSNPRIDCRLIEDDGERLRCYDEREDSCASGQASDQAQGQKHNSALPVERIAVTIVDVKEGESRTRYFYTDDGQIWRQTGRGSWSLSVPFQAELKPGSLGSFFIVTEGGKSARVKRVQ